MNKSKVDRLEDRLLKWFGGGGVEVAILEFHSFPTANFCIYIGWVVVRLRLPT